MNISELCIRRPVMTTLVMAAILVFGAMAYTRLPVSDLPNVDYPTIQVSASLPGASPQTMASSVATPLEKQFSTIAGLDSMNSTNMLGMSQITLVFSLSRNIDAAAQDVQAAIAKAARQLPPDMPSPPTFQKVNPADQPIFFMALSSPTLPLGQVEDYAEIMLSQRISMVDGVAQVQVYGSRYAVRIQVDPRELAARGIGLDEVATAVANQNVNLPVGVLNGPQQAFTLQATGQLLEAEAYEPLIVASRGDSPVRISDLGRAIDSLENDKTMAWFNGRPAVILAVYRQPGTNTVAVVDRVNSVLSTIRLQLPGAITLSVLYDRSIGIRQSVEDVEFTLVLTIGLVILVIFLFLRNLSATLIPSLALPLSLVGTFAAMYLMDFSIDIVSMLALTLSVGFVVDDAIVMLENIIRHIEMGEKPFEAAVKGAKQIAFTILSMTLSLAAVFIPVLFMEGLVGRVLHEFAVTIMVAILVSGFVSLTLTPMLCSRFIRHYEKGQESLIQKFVLAITKPFDLVFEATRITYAWTLKLATRTVFARVVTLGIFAASVVAVGWLFAATPRDFIPTEDTGRFFLSTEAAQGISFSSMVDHQQEIMKIVTADPNVDSYFSSVGGGGGSTNSGRVFVALKPITERQKNSEQILQAWRPALSAIPGIQAYGQIPPIINTGGRLAKSLYQYTLQGPDTDELYAAGANLEAALKKVDLLQDVTSDAQIRNPQVNVVIDRDRASILHVSPARIEQALSTAYGSRQISTIYTANNQHQVIMELLPQFQADPNSLALLYVRGDTGKLVPLNAVTKLERNVGPLAINHAGQLPAVTVSFNVRPGVPLGDAVKAVSDTALRTLPATVTGNFQGNAQAFQASNQGMMMLIIMAVLVIYMILGILYESFIHPLTILSGLPAAGLGALLTLQLFHYPLSLYAFVGIIMLVGIVKKNAIMMIDFAIDARRNEGKTAQEAIIEGCLIRFRPIMMTTMAALMGTLPIALALGASATSRRPLGLAVVGGLIVSQIMTLYITPVIYLFFESVMYYYHWTMQVLKRLTGSPAHRQAHGAAGAPSALSPDQRP